VERQWGLREPTQEGDTVIRVLAIAALLALAAPALAVAQEAYPRIYENYSEGQALVDYSPDTRTSNVTGLDQPQSSIFYGTQHHSPGEVQHRPPR
jgi:hypothetical protein